MIKLSAARKRAYFAGVDLFCKESCFDAADTAAMHQLIEKFGYINRTEEHNPLAFLNLPQPPPRPTYGPGVRLPGDPVKKTRPAKPAAPAPSRSIAARPTPAVAAAPTAPAAGGAKFPGQIYGGAMAGAMAGAQPGSQAGTAPAFAGPTPIGPTKGTAQPAGTSPYPWPDYDPSGRIQPTPGLPEAERSTVDLANSKWETAKKMYVRRKRLGEDPVRAANLALQEAGMPARFQEFVNIDPDLQKLMGAPRSPGMRVGTAVPPAEQASSMGTAEQAPAQQMQAQIPTQQMQAQIPTQQMQAQIPTQQTQAQVPAQQTQAQVPARRNRASGQAPAQQAQAPAAVPPANRKWTATGSIEGGPTMAWYGPGGPAEPRRTVG